MSNLITFNPFLRDENGHIVEDKDGKKIQMTEKAQIEYLHKLSSSLNEALDSMQKERNKLADALGVIKTDFASLESAYTIQKNINIKVITDFNLEKQALLDEVQALRRGDAA